jgi:hypothetical protein
MRKSLKVYSFHQVNLQAIKHDRCMMNTEQQLKEWYSFQVAELENFMFQ